MLQLGARFYWPEVGRFVSQDPIGDGVNWYIYAEDNPLYWIDADGLDVTIPGLSGQPWLVFDAGSVDQLGMSAAATASGVVTGATLGLWRPDWSSPCDRYGTFSRGMGVLSGAALTGAAAAYAGGVEVNVLSRGNVFKIVSKRLRRGFRIDPGHHGKRWGHPRYWKW